MCQVASFHIFVRVLRSLCLCLFLMKWFIDAVHDLQCSISHLKNVWVSVYVAVVCFRLTWKQCFWLTEMRNVRPGETSTSIYVLLSVAKLNMLAAFLLLLLLLNVQTGYSDFVWYSELKSTCSNNFQWAWSWLQCCISITEEKLIVLQKSS